MVAGSAVRSRTTSRGVLGNILKGGADAYSAYEDRQAQKQLSDDQLAYLREKQQKITEGYAVDPSVLVGGHKPGTWYYDPRSRQVVQAGATGTA